MRTKKAERLIHALHCSVGPARTGSYHARMKKRPANCVNTIHPGAIHMRCEQKCIETGWFTVHLLNAIGFQIAAAFAADTITVSCHDKKTSINPKKNAKIMPLRRGRFARRKARLRSHNFDLPRDAKTGVLWEYSGSRKLAYVRLFI